MKDKSKLNLRIAVGLGMLLPLLALACSLVVPEVNYSFPGSEATVEVRPQQEQGTNPEDNNTSSPAQQSTIQPTAIQPTPAPMQVPEGLLEEESILTNLYLRAHPSVVNISVFGNQNGELIAVSEGSGWVYDQAGYIVTNAHVVHGADRVEVIFYDQTSKEAEIVGEDLHSDLAVVKVDLPEEIGALPLGNMDQLAVGQTVIAIGNPFGLEGTLTRGVISALGRSIPALTAFTIPQSIQTDAAINPGNSGGPLLNLNGEVIGVNAQIETDGQSRTNSGVGFAIPISIVKRVVPDLINDGEHVWAYMGVSGGSLNSLIVQAMNLPVDKGAYIDSITDPNGPAGSAGMQGSSGQETIDQQTVPVGGDVVTAINGQPVGSFEDLLIYIALNTSPGDRVILTVIRDRETIEVPVTLGKRPNTPTSEIITP